ncbi:cyclic-di-AMP receptor [Clostridium sp. D2Q-11]|uniref:Cyclic-di-AMP receptor n=1 Tax=Anaeromonas frigoriresistens TaxID=2683708 RepID=A0A942V0R5_9FIRM|nr:cyclic-di-AMP receptor [Anaeromonas frigoriresistens]MBS4537932.1 cyclic-di-AMP receptor [Anaeromonas frigoriresistens]
MKLVFAIVQDEDAHKLVDKLMKNEFGVTKLASTGGFLRAGNTTLIIGVEKERVDEVIGLIGEVAKTRTQVATTPPPTTWSQGVYMPYPVEVEVGGATIFVVDVDRFEKV